MTRSGLFDAIRPFAPDQCFTPAMVTMVDALADRFGLARVTSLPWLPLALDVIREFEGCELVAYPDPATKADPWTIGFGHTGKDVVPGLRWTKEQAEVALATDAVRFGDGVEKLLQGAATRPAQMAAMVSLAFNVGLSNVGGSTLLKMHKASDYEGAARQFVRWNRAAGKVMAGLTRRRETEARLYQGDA